MVALQYPTDNRGDGWCRFIALHLEFRNGVGKGCEGFAWGEGFLDCRCSRMHASQPSTSQSCTCAATPRCSPHLLPGAKRCSSHAWRGTARAGTACPSRQLPISSTCCWAWTTCHLQSSAAPATLTGE